MIQLFAGTLVVATVLYAWHRLRIELAKLDEEERQQKSKKTREPVKQRDEIETLIVDEKTGVYRTKDD